MRGERWAVWFCVPPVSGVESSGFVLWWLVAQWWGRSEHYWGFLLFGTDFMRSTVWFKIFNQPQNGFKWSFSPLNLFISWITLFLTVTYFVGFYVWQILDEQPEINIFGAHITAFFELIQCAVILPCRHGCEYMESAVSFLAGLAGIFEPGVIAHSPRNYVNAVRLGPCRLSRKTPRNSLSSVCFILRALVVSFLGCLCAMFMGFWRWRKGKSFLNSERTSMYSPILLEIDNTTSFIHLTLMGWKRATF